MATSRSDAHDATQSESQAREAKPASSGKEAAIQQAILTYLGTRTDLRAARMNTGAARTRNGRVIKFGVKGQADIMGILAPHGKIVCIEVKGAKGRLRPEQVRFRDMIRRFGGIYIEARSVADVEAVIGK